MDLLSGLLPLPDLEAALAARIRACFPQVSFTRTHLILDGWDAVVLEGDERLIFRFPRRVDVLPGFAKEIRLLPLLKNLPARTPHYRWVAYPDQPDHHDQFVGYEKIPGEALLRHHLHPALIRQISGFLAALHSLPMEIAVQGGLEQTSRADWVQEYEDLYAVVRQVLFPHLSTSGQAKTAQLWESFLEGSARTSFPMTLIHRDLDTGHVLVEGAPAGLTGVIDWGDAALGDPALDFVGFHWLGGERLVRELLDGYPLEPGSSFWERIDFYQSLGPYYLALSGLQAGEQARAEEGIRGIENARYQAS